MAAGKTPVTRAEVVKLIAVAAKEIGRAIFVRDSRLDALERRVAKSLAEGDSVERRLSRHGAHLAGLETRLKSIKRGEGNR
ncbi:MAG: hypothetical protein AB7P31_15180 [Steroidobacteraceae bacterium]